MTLLWVIAGWVSTDAFAEEPLHLSFWDESDVLDTAGARIDFGANVLRADGILSGYPDMWFGCEVPRDDESAWVYGWRMLPAQEGAERTIEVIRAYTNDGRTFAGEETVLSLEDVRWQGFANVVYRPTDGSIFLFSYSAARLRVFRSEDGSTWQNLTDEAYVNHDAMNVTWYPPWGEFLNYQNTLEPYPKRYPDNIGEHRRVFSFLRSTDGVNWDDCSPEFLNGAARWRPDDEDPVDLEFYRGIVFPTEGRYAMLLQDYIAPPPEANSRRGSTKHGPRSLVEWAISRDGLNWSRPHRDLDVSEQVGSLPVQGPLTRDGKHLFYQRNGAISALDVGRLFFATSLGNGEFSTVPFQMPTTGLTLNVDASYPANQGDTGRAYVMAELQNEQGQTIPGYERTHTVIEDIDEMALPLTWNGKTGNELTGRTVRLRFSLRDAKVYAVSAAE